MNIKITFSSFRRKAVLFTFFICIISFFSVELSAQEIEAAAVIKNISEDSQKGAIFNYSYMMKISYQRFKNGKLDKKFTRLYEAILPSRFALNRTYSHPFILIQDSERKITAMEIAAMRKDLAKELERAESEDEKQVKEKLPSNDGGYWTMRFTNDNMRVKVDVLKLLSNSHLTNFQRVQIDGRDTIIINFSPKSDAVFDDSLAYLSKIEGMIWVDEKDRRIIRIEGFPIGTLETNKNKTETERSEETVFFFQQTKVKEGFWFPLTAWLNFTKLPQDFGSVRIDFSFSDYKKASVEVQTVDMESSSESEESKQ